MRFGCRRCRKQYKKVHPAIMPMFPHLRQTQKQKFSALILRRCYSFVWALRDRLIYYGRFLPYFPPLHLCMFQVQNCHLSGQAGGLRKIHVNTCYYAARVTHAECSISTNVKSNISLGECYIKRVCCRTEDN